MELANDSKNSDDISISLIKLKNMLVLALQLGFTFIHLILQKFYQERLIWVFQ